MNDYQTHCHDRGETVAAFTGLLMAVMVAAIATAPAHWVIAVLILVVLAMPACLVVKPVLLHLRAQQATSAPDF